MKCLSIILALVSTLSLASCGDATAPQRMPAGSVFMCEPARVELQTIAGVADSVRYPARCFWRLPVGNSTKRAADTGSFLDDKRRDQSGKPVRS